MINRDRSINLKKKITSGIEKVVIIGHKGFIGGHLEKFFKNNSPKIDVIGKDLPEIDLTDKNSSESLKEIFNMKTAVIMCSAIKKQQGDNIDIFWKNLQMTVNLCKILETHPVKRFVFFSSVAVYGEEIHNLNISEKTTVNPTSYYGLAKYSSEVLLSKILDSKTGSLMIVRPPVIYGPGDQPCYGPSGFVNSVINKEQIVLWGDGTEKREFIFIEDAVKLLHDLTFHTYTGSLNIVSGKNYTFTEIIAVISSIIGSGVSVNFKERSKQKVDHQFLNNRLVDLFPDFQFTSLQEGIQKTIEYAKVKKLNEMIR